MPITSTDRDLERALIVLVAAAKASNGKHHLFTEFCRAFLPVIFGYLEELQDWEVNALARVNVEIQVLPGNNGAFWAITPDPENPKTGKKFLSTQAPGVDFWATDVGRHTQYLAAVRLAALVWQEVAPPYALKFDYVAAAMRR